MLLKGLIKKNLKEWDPKLAQGEFAYNQSKSPSHKISKILGQYSCICAGFAFPVYVLYQFYIKKL